MKVIILFFIILLSSTFESQSISDTIQNLYKETIRGSELKYHIKNLTTEEMAGREYNTAGSIKAAGYILNFLNEEDKANQNEQLAFVSHNQIEINKVIFNTKNVVGFVPANSPDAEAIVIGAHYDHVGKEGDKIWHGADDNASGVAALLELYEAFIYAYKSGFQPNKNLYFVFFDAEEYGLVGSYSFVKLFPFKKMQINSMINMDMIGRVDANYGDKKNYVYVVGSDYISNLDDVLKKVNQKSEKLILDYQYNSTSHPEQIYRRSDYFPFILKDIPVVGFTSGIHPDYHQPTDTEEKINYTQLFKRTRLAFDLIWELAFNVTDLEIEEKKVRKLKNKINSPVKTKYYYNKLGNRIPF